MNKTIQVDTLDKRMALISAMESRIVSLTEMMDGSCVEFKHLFGKDIVILRAMVADLRNQ